MQTHVVIPIGNERITGELFVPTADIAATMLLCHGWTSSNKKYLEPAKRLSSRGILSFALNLRGHGDSKYPLKKYSRQDHLTDVLAAVDYLRDLYPNKPLIALGKSYGGYLCAIASSLRTINYLILSQPALYPDADFSFPNEALIQKNPDIFRSKNESITSNRALKAVSQFDRPLLIIESEHDEVLFNIPKLYIKASKNNKRRSTIVIPETDHLFSRPEWLEDYYKKIIEWIETHLIT